MKFTQCVDQLISAADIFLQTKAVIKTEHCYNLDFFKFNYFLELMCKWFIKLKYFMHKNEKNCWFI